MSRNYKLMLKTDELAVPALPIPESQIINAAFPMFEQAMNDAATKLSDSMDRVNSVRRLSMASFPKCS